MKDKGFDPVLAAVAVVLGAFAIIVAFLFATFIVLPIAAIAVAAFFIYRYNRVQKIQSAENIPATIKDRPQFLSPSEFYRAIGSANLLQKEEEDTGKYSCPPLVDVFNQITAALYDQESFHEAPIIPDTTDRITLGRYYDQLAAWQRKVSDNNNFELFTNLMLQVWLGLREHFQPFALQDTPDTVPDVLTTRLKISNERKAISKVMGGFFDQDFKRRKLFQELRTQIEENVEPLDDDTATFTRCFARTPFRLLSRTDIPVPIPDETRFAGTWVVAPQGTGKTTLLHALIARDIEKDASIILMDSKGELIEPFLNHPALAGRRILIGPDNPVAMNPLDIPYTDINKAVDNLEYLFSSLLEFKLTATQSMLLKVVLRSLVTAFPSPTLETFRDLLTNDGPKTYGQYIQKLEPDLRNFFATEFFTDNIKGRRQELSQRLRMLLDHDLLRSMLMASSTSFKIGEAMDSGKFVIINNSRGQMGNQGAEFFGRFFIAQVLAAAQARSLRPTHEKKPVYFYIDECYTVIARDERITDILHECRSQKIGLILAHQETTQVSDKVLSALQNCAIRFAHPDEEARKLSPIMRMDVKTLQSMKPRSQFGAYIRGLSQTGFVVNVHPPDISTIQPRKLSHEPIRTLAAHAPPLEESGLRSSLAESGKADTSGVSPPDSAKPPPTSPKDEPSDSAAEWDV